MSSRQRVGAIDFWRGFVLLAILIDHVPGNLIEAVTPRNFGFSDSAEAFVFLSGLSVGLIYFRKAVEGGMLGVAKRCIGRACRIYGVHVALTCCAIVIFAAAYAVRAVPNLIEADGRNYVFHEPARAILGIVMLSQQLGYFNILPMYIVLMVWSPVVLALARFSIPLTLIASLAIYAGARTLGLALPNWPEPGTWFFNPFAWQLVFTLGIVSGILWRGARVPFSSIAFAGSIVVLVFSAIAVSSGFGLLPGLHDQVFRRLDLLKQNLGLVRLVHFLALAYFVSQVPALSRVAQTWVGGELQRLGRHSLAIFAMGSVLCALGQAVMRVAEVNLDAIDELIGMLYTLFGIAGLVLLARHIEGAKPSAAGHAEGAGGSPGALVPLPLNVSTRPQPARLEQP